MSTALGRRAVGVDDLVGFWRSHRRPLLGCKLFVRWARLTRRKRRQDEVRSKVNREVNMKSGGDNFEIRSRTRVSLAKSVEGCLYSLIPLVGPRQMRLSALSFTPHSTTRVYQQVSILDRQRGELAMEMSTSSVNSAGAGALVSQLLRSSDVFEGAEEAFGHQVWAGGAGISCPSGISQPSSARPLRDCHLVQR